MVLKVTESYDGYDRRLLRLFIKFTDYEVIKPMSEIMRQVAGYPERKRLIKDIICQRVDSRVYDSNGDKIYIHKWRFADNNYKISIVHISPDGRKTGKVYWTVPSVDGAQLHGYFRIK